MLILENIIDSIKDRLKFNKNYNSIKNQLAQQEKDILNAVFKINKKSPSNFSEFEEKYGVTHEQAREVLRNVYKRFKSNINQMQYSSHIYIEDSIWIKCGDILELHLDLDNSIEEADVEPDVFKYWVEYIHNGESYMYYDFDIQKDFAYNDIEDFVKESLEIDTGITGYELYDAKDEYFNKSAKILVKEI